MWPMLLDYTKDDCKRMLRKFELEAYSSVVTALRAQGDLNKDKKKILQDLASILSISLERHRGEVRRAVNDERLNTIANYISGVNTSIEWSIEGRRLIPLLPRLVPQTLFTGVANTAANLQMTKNQSMTSPVNTGNKVLDTNIFDDTFQSNQTKRRRIDSQSQSSIQSQSTTIFPIKSNSIYEQMVLQKSPTLSPNHRLVSQSPTKVSASSSRTVLNTNNYTTVSPQSIAQTGTRVIFVSSTPTTTSANILNTNTKNLTAFPLIARHTIGSPQRQPIEIQNTSRPPKQRPGRPATINTSIVGLIGVSNPQKQVKTPVIKTTLNNTNNLTVAQNVTTIPFLSGTKVFTKTGGQQQVVVFPVNQKPMSVPISQSVKAISIPSSTSSSMTTNTPTFIYQNASNVKNVQKVQTPNLIIMQPKQVIQTSRPITVPTTAITLSKANIAKTQTRNPMLSTKKQLNTNDMKYSQEMSSHSANQSQISNLNESQKILAKKLQTSAKCYQEINSCLPEFANKKIIEIGASNEAITGLINSVKSGQISSSDIMEIVKQANLSKVNQQFVEHKAELHRDVHNDSSSEDTVSTSESPHHEMQTDFIESSIIMNTEIFKTTDK